MTREVTDPNGVTWTCAEAYAGLTDDAGAHDRAAEHSGGVVEVVCTPSGRARTVRLQLAPDWQTSFSDAQLLEEITSHQAAPL